MEDIKKNIDEEIRLVSEAWATKFLGQRRSILERRRIKATGSLINSLDHEVLTNAADAAVRIAIAFDEEGRIAEMRRYQYAHDKWGRNAIGRMENWVISRGLEGFISGFMSRNPRYKNVPQNVVNYIAWSILVTRSGGKFRRRPWWNKAKTAAVDDLYNQVATTVLNEAADGLTDSFTAFDFAKYARVTGREGAKSRI